MEPKIQATERASEEPRSGSQQRVGRRRGMCADGGSCKGTHPLICRDHGCGIEAHREYQKQRQAPPTDKLTDSRRE